MPNCDAFVRVGSYGKFCKKDYFHVRPLQEDGAIHIPCLVQEAENLRIMTSSDTEVDAPDECVAAKA